MISTHHRVVPWKIVNRIKLEIALMEKMLRYLRLSAMRFIAMSRRSREEKRIEVSETAVCIFRDVSSLA